MCEVIVEDFSVPIDSNSETDTFSMLSSDTEYEGDVHIGWNLDDFNDFVSKRHWEQYCRDQSYTVIMRIKDRRVHDAEKFHNLLISHKFLLDKKCTGTRYYCHSNNSKIGNEIFTGVFYSPTNSYVNWPGQYVGTGDHQVSNPLYCVVDWKSNTSSPAKPQKFYMLCTIKEQYHKLFTPANQSKVFFPPSEQCGDINLDSSVLFSRRNYK